MTNHGSWLNRIVVLLVWVLVTAGISFYVARNAGDNGNAVDVTAPLPPIAIDQRATVSLEDKTIVPIVSASGTVMNYNGTWMLEAPATSADVAYRLLDPPVGVRAQINGGPSGFTCTWLGLGQMGVVSPSGNDVETGATPVATPLASGVASFAPIGDPDDQPDQPDPDTQPTGGPGPSTAGVTMRCAIPDDVRVASGMSGLMVLQMGQPHDAQALPVTAVVGAVDQGQVVVVHEDGSTEARTVQLGVSDIYNIEITDGLEPDEAVLQTPTQADFAQAEAGS